MKKICFYMILPICLILAAATESHAQKKVKGKPENFVMPVDYFDNTGTYQAFLRKTSPKSKENGWLVISDRDNNNIYDKPNGSVISTVNFRDFFFVVDEKEEWIKIIKARVDELKIVKGSKEDVGWVPKTKMLLWNSGVIGQVTRIHKKILLLNRADQIESILNKEDKDMVKIYTGPETEEREKDRRIFEYFFMLKKENDRYLLSEEANVNPFAPEKIVGWVSARDCDIWDTRICLEPNFVEDAYQERLNKPELRIRAFESNIGAMKSLKGNGRESDVFWSNDPVGIPSSAKAKSDSKRFLGSVVRFPMVSISQSEGTEIYKSGIVGKIKLVAKDGKLLRDLPENRIAQLEKQLNQLENKSTKVNIYYIIEGTDASYPFKQVIIQAMRDVHKDLAQQKLAKVNYGALIYRDTPEESVDINGQTVNRMTEQMSLSSDIDGLLSFVQNAEFKNKKDRDEYTSMYYGVNEALKKGGFNVETKNDELNIIMLLGCFGDFRADRDRRKVESGHKAFFDPDEINRIVANISGIDAHLYALHLRNGGYRPSTAFVKAAQNLILENAKILYNEQQPRINSGLKDKFTSYGFSNYDQGPVLELDKSKAVAVMDHGAIPGNIVTPFANQDISNSALAGSLRKNIETSINHIVNLKKATSMVLNEGDLGDLGNLTETLDIEPRDAGTFAKGFMNVLIKMLEDNPKVSLPDVLDEKYKLFTEAYIPYKLPKAEHPLVSYVLFMPETDLIDYHRTIERCNAGMGITSYDKKRESLFQLYKSLLDQFTGEGASFAKNEDEITINDVQRLMQGINNSGLRLDENKEIPIVKILDEKKISNEEVDDLIRRFKVVEDKLSKILRDADTYDFCYKTDDFNRYYWIPIEDAF